MDEDTNKVERISYWAIVWGQVKKNKLGMCSIWCIIGLVLLAVFAPLVSLNKPFLFQPHEIPVGKLLTYEPQRVTVSFNDSPSLQGAGDNAADTVTVTFRLKGEVRKTVVTLQPGETAGVEAGKHAGQLSRDMDGRFFYTPGAAYPFFSSLFDRGFFENGIDIFFNLIMVLSPLYLLVWLVGKMCHGRLWRWRRGRYLWGFFLGTLIGFILLQCFPVRYPSVDYRDLEEKLTDKGIKVRSFYPLRKYSYREIDVGMNNPRPPDENHWLGTDKAGRDVFARMVYGTRISLTIGVVAVSIYVTIGVVLGSLAGYFGGKVDMFISRFVEVMLCFPVFFLILTIVAFIEKRTIFHVMLVIGITRWTGVARLVRGEFLRLKGMDYVQAAIALGISRMKIIFSHVLPNALAPVLVSATFGIAAAILTESSLAFLGLGDPSAPSWGEILSMGRVEQKLWLILVPGLAIFFVVSIFNLVGETLRDALDPRLRQ